jgi:3-hydroxyisobutyrate dehydrogenase-like beta-hydroxyacid dehydrogenase
VHLVLAADDAVDAVVGQLRAGLGDGVPLVDHSTNLPARVEQRTASLRGAGVRYVSAPVFMSPQNAREATGMMLLCGPRDECAALEPLLQPMTGKVFWVGERTDLAAQHKLAGNGLLLGLCGLLGDLMAMGAARGLDAGVVLSLFEVWKVGGAMGVFGQRVATAGEAPASFELTMARKDLGLMLETAGQAELCVLPAVAAAMDRAIAAGKGREDFAIFARPAR